MEARSRYQQAKLKQLLKNLTAEVSSRQAVPLRRNKEKGLAKLIKGF
jgi:hypothetical protein